MIQKVYIAYNSEGLYAYTINKDYYLRFKEERNPKKMKYKTVELEDIEFSIFSNKYKSEMMIESPLSVSESDYVFIISTYAEDSLLNSYIDDLESEMGLLCTRVKESLNMKDKYEKSIDYIGNISKFVNGDLRSNINALAVFMKLFSNTL